MIEIKIKRVYEKPGPQDGTRILVDRLWPRGLTKEAVKVDCWARTLSPSNELRKWYGHAPEKWDEFQRRYAAELDKQEAALALLLEKLAKGPATFLYGSTEPKFNNAVALKYYLEKRKQRR